MKTVKTLENKAIERTPSIRTCTNTTSGQVVGLPSLTLKRAEVSCRILAYLMRVEMELYGHRDSQLLTLEINGIVPSKINAEIIQHPMKHSGNQSTPIETCTP